jgi:hypothetical protein
MNDNQVFDTIEQLVEEEHRLLRRAEGGEHSLQDHKRLEEVKVELDRYWDLLRQRRAREEFGLDPDDASRRDGPTVEGYQQ